MRRMHVTFIALGSLALAGCSSGGLSPTQHEKATEQWNGARATALASLANDQYSEGSFEKCQETLGQAILLQPKSAPLRLLAARLAIEQNRLEVADAQLSEARTLDPKNAEAWYLTGIVYQRWQQFDRAEAAFAEASRKNPAEVSYVLADAEITVALGRPVEALALLQRNTDTFPHSAALRDEIGQLLVAQKQFAAGIAALNEACRLATDDLTLREHLAFALLAGRQYVQAGQALERLVNSPGYEKRADVRAALADCQAQGGALELAQANYESAANIDPAQAGYWLGLAKVDLQLADPAAADIALRRALSIDARNSDAQCLLGYVRLRQGALADALVAFDYAAKLDPGSSRCVSLQAYVLTRLNRRREAKVLVDRALRIDASDELARNLQGGLAAAE